MMTSRLHSLTRKLSWISPALLCLTFAFALPATSRAAVWAMQGQLAESSPVSPREAYYAIHTFEMEAGTRYDISLSSGQFDTFLALLDPSGQRIAFNDNTNGSTDSELSFTPAMGGTFRIVASASRPLDTGSYQLLIGTPPPVQEQPVGGGLTYYSVKLKASYQWQTIQMQGLEYKVAVLAAAPDLGSPLHQLGLKTGDAITRLDGIRVTSPMEMETHEGVTTVRYIRSDSTVVQIGQIIIPGQTQGKVCEMPEGPGGLLP